MACHNLDPAIWALDLTHPTSVEAHSTRLSDETVPVGAVYYYEYPARGDMPPLTMTWHEGGLLPPRPAELEEGRRMEDEGIYFVGDDGVILCGGWGGISAHHPGAEDAGVRTSRQDDPPGQRAPARLDRSLQGRGPHELQLRLRRAR